MTQKMANAKMRDYEPMSDETGYVPVDAVFSAPAPALVRPVHDGAGIRVG